MARIQIKDLPKEGKISKKKMQKILGGKLSIGQPEDKNEKEADQVADSVMTSYFKT
jgi:hypothetical protein